MERAIAYIRVSSQRQVEEGSSLDSQTKQVTQFAAAHGYSLLRIFREEGESAKTDQRPRLQEMLAYCRDRQNGVTVVIVPKIDRLARNVSDYTNLKLQLSRLRIRLESLGERIEDTPVGRFTETILASVAQFDNEIRAERSKGGMVEAASQGRWVWKAPIGYRTVRHNGKGTIEPDPVAAPVIRRAFKLIVEGHQGSPAVREYMRRAGVSQSESSFYYMIRNEAYIGRIRAFSKVFTASPPFVPLIDDITFYKARAALRPSKLAHQYELESEDFPLRGTMTCACGKRFTASFSKGQQGKAYAYYRCIHCKGRSFPRETVHRFFLRELSAYKGEEGAWERLKERLRHFDGQVTAQEEQARATGAERIHRLRTLQDAIALKNATGVLSDEVAKRQINSLEIEIEEVSSLIPAQSAEIGTDELIEFARRFFFDLKESWTGFGLRTKKDLLRFMFPKGILYHPENGFRTSESSLSEQVKREVSGVDLHLADPTLEFSKDLRG